MNINKNKKKGIYVSSFFCLRIKIKPTLSFLISVIVFLEILENLIYQRI